MGLAVDHAPTEGEVPLKDFVAHINEDGVHTWNHIHKKKDTNNPSMRCKELQILFLKMQKDRPQHTFTAFTAADQFHD